MVRRFFRGKEITAKEASIIAKVSRGKSSRKRRRKQEERSAQIKKALDRSAENITKQIQETTAKKLSTPTQKVDPSSIQVKLGSSVQTGLIPVSQFKALGGRVALIGTQPSIRRFVDRGRIINEKGFYVVDPKTGKRSFETTSRTIVRKSLKKQQEALKDRKFKTDLAKGEFFQTKVTDVPAKLKQKQLVISEQQDKLIRFNDKLNKEFDKLKTSSDNLLKKIGVKGDSFVGKVFQNIAFFTLASPVFTLSLGGNTAALIDNLSKPETRSKAFKDLIQSTKELPQSLKSQFNPKNPEGLANLIILAASLGIVKLASKKGTALKSKARSKNVKGTRNLRKSMLLTKKEKLLPKSQQRKIILKKQRALIRANKAVNRNNLIQKVINFFKLKSSKERLKSKILKKESKLTQKKLDKISKKLKEKEIQQLIKSKKLDAKSKKSLLKQLDNIKRTKKETLKLRRDLKTLFGEKQDVFSRFFRRAKELNFRFRDAIRRANIRRKLSKDASAKRKAEIKKIKKLGKEATKLRKDLKKLFEGKLTLKKLLKKLKDIDDKWKDNVKRNVIQQQLDKQKKISKFNQKLARKKELAEKKKFNRQAQEEFNKRQKEYRNLLKLVEREEFARTLPKTLLKSLKSKFKSVKLKIQKIVKQASVKKAKIKSILKQLKDFKKLIERVNDRIKRQEIQRRLDLDKAKAKRIKIIEEKSAKAKRRAKTIQNLEKRKSIQKELNKILNLIEKEQKVRTSLAKLRNFFRTKEYKTIINKLNRFRKNKDLVNQVEFYKRLSKNMEPKIKPVQKKAKVQTFSRITKRQFSNPNTNISQTLITIQEYERLGNTVLLNTNRFLNSVKPDRGYLVTTKFPKQIKITNDLKQLNKLDLIPSLDKKINVTLMVSKRILTKSLKDLLISPKLNRSQKLKIRNTIKVIQSSDKALNIAQAKDIIRISRTVQKSKTKQKSKQKTKRKPIKLKLPKLPKKKTITEVISKRIKTIPKTEFRPSLTAVLNNIKGKIPKTITGAELRPIVEKAIKDLQSEEEKKKKKKSKKTTKKRKVNKKKKSKRKR